MGQYLGGGDLVAFDQLPGEGAEGGDLGFRVGLPASQVGGQGRFFLVIPEIHYLDAQRTGVEPGILVPAAAACVPGALVVGYQLVDRERSLIGVAGEQVVGAYLVR